MKKHNKLVNDTYNNVSKLLNVYNDNRSLNTEIEESCAIFMQQVLDHLVIIKDYEKL